MSMLNPVQSFVDMTGAWQQWMRDKANQQNVNQIQSDAKSFYQEWLNSTNDTAKRSNMSASNLNSLAWAILTYAESKWKYEEYANLSPSQIVLKFLDKNKGRGYDKYVNQLTWGELSLEETTRLIWINQNVVNPISMSADADDEDFDPTLLSNFDYSDMEEWNTTSAGESWNWPAKWWVWIWTAIWADLWLNVAWRIGTPIMKWIYSSQFNTPEAEQYRIRKLNQNVKDAESEVKVAQQKLKTARANKEWVEEATKELTKAKLNLKNAKDEAKNVETRAKTAYDNNIWWSNEMIRDNAYNKAQNLFKNEIEPLLKNSEDVVNVPDLIKSIDIEDVVEIDPTRKSAIWDALEEMLEEYTKWDKFNSLSLEDAQKLKSELYKELPDSMWKWKKIPASDRKIVRQLLSNKLRETIQESLDKSLTAEWKDAARLYRQYSNLEKISEESISKISKGSWKMWELSKWVNSVWKKTWEPITSGLSLLFSKWFEFLKNNTWGKGLKKVFKRLWDNEIVKNFKWTIWKWVRVWDPIGTIQLMQTVWDLWDSAMWGETLLWNITDQFSNIPAINAMEVMENLYSAADEWNNMTEEERVKALQDSRREDYWADVSYEEALNRYNSWKEEEWNPDGTIKMNNLRGLGRLEWTMPA